MQINAPGYNPNDGSYKNIPEHVVTAVTQMVTKPVSAMAKGLRDFIGVAQDKPNGTQDAKQPLYDTSGALTPYAKSVDAGKINDPLGRFIIGLDASNQAEDQQSFQNPLPHTVFGQGTQGMIGVAPDIATASLFPEADGMEAISGIQKLKSAIWNPFTKVLIAKGGLQGYSEAEQKGATPTEAAKEGAKGAVLGGVNGAVAGTLGGIGGSLSDGGMKILVDAGLVKSNGAITKAALDAASDATVFAAYPVATAIAQGKKVDWDEVKSNIGMGLTFGLIKGNKTLGQDEELNTNIRGILGDRQAIALQNFVNADPEAIKAAYQSKATVGDTNAKAIEYAHQANQEADAGKKNELVLAASTLAKTSDVKGVTETILHNKEAFVQHIEQSDLPDATKKQIIDKVNLIHSTIDPYEQDKQQASAGIQQTDQAIEQMRPVMQDPAVQADPIKKTEAEVAMEKLQQQKEQLFKKLKGSVSDQMDQQVANHVPVDNVPAELPPSANVPEEEPEVVPGEQGVANELEKENGGQVNEKEIIPENPVIRENLITEKKLSELNNGTYLHGSPVAGLTELKNDFSGVSTGTDSAKKGIWVTSNNDVAKMYRDWKNPIEPGKTGDIYKAKLNVENPMYTEDTNEKGRNEAIAKAEKNGNDSIVFEDENGGKHILVLDHNKVKLINKSKGQSEQISVAETASVPVEQELKSTTKPGQIAEAFKNKQIAKENFDSEGYNSWTQVHNKLSGEDNPQVGESGFEGLTESPKEKQYTAKKKAIDAVVHGIVVPDNIMGRDPSARFDFEMTTAEKRKAVIDIKEGNYETAPAKKILTKLQEWDDNDNYPIIEGLGGSAVRRKGATSAEIQQQIDEGKSGMLSELSPEEIERHNKSLADLGITHEDIKAHEEYEKSRDYGTASENAATGVQQSENEQKSSAEQSTGGETSQGSEPKIKEENKDAVPIETAGKMGVRDTSAVGEGVGKQDRSVEPAAESKPSEEVQKNGKEAPANIGRQSAGEHGLSDIADERFGEVLKKVAESGNKKLWHLSNATLTLKEENILENTNKEYGDLFDKDNQGKLDEKGQTRLKEIYRAETLKKQIRNLKETYEKAKADGSDPEFVKTVENALTNNQYYTAGGSAESPTFEETEGKPVPNDHGLDLFVHDRGDDFAVSEGSTGLKIATGATEEDAITHAHKLLEEKTPEAIKSKLDAQYEKGIQSPRGRIAENSEDTESYKAAVAKGTAAVREAQAISGRVSGSEATEAEKQSAIKSIDRGLAAVDKELEKQGYEVPNEEPVSKEQELKDKISDAKKKLSASLKKDRGTLKAGSPISAESLKAAVDLIKAYTDVGIYKFREIVKDWITTFGKENFTDDDANALKAAYSAHTSNLTPKERNGYNTIDDIDRFIEQELPSMLGNNPIASMPKRTLPTNERLPVDKPLPVEKEAKANYSAMGRLKDIRVRNLEQLKKFAQDVGNMVPFREVRKAATSKSQSSILLKTATDKIVKLVGKEGWQTLREALLESRLRGARARWNNFAEDIYHYTNLEMDDLFKHGQDGQMYDLINGLDGLEGEVNPARFAQALISNGNYDDARQYIADVFGQAADKVLTLGTLSNGKTFDEMVQDGKFTDPKMQEALEGYKDLLEKPLTESHQSNEGVMSDANGPLDTYYPAIATGDDQHFSAAAKPFRNPDNINNSFMTGHSENYSTAIADLSNALTRSIKTNNKSNALDALEKAGLIKSVPHNEKETGTMNINGETYEAVKEKVAEGRTIVGPDGNIIHTPSRYVAMPKWLSKELKPVFDANNEFDKFSAFGRFNNILVKYTLGGPIEATAHSMRLLSGITNSMPFMQEWAYNKGILGKAGGMVANNPFVKSMVGIGKILNTDISSDRALQSIQEMSRIGVIPEKTWTKTWSKEFAELMNAKKVPIWDFSPLLYGKRSLDLKARVTMYNLTKAMNPEATPEQHVKMQQELGVYTNALQGELEKFVKQNGFAPFYSFSSAIYRAGIKSVLGSSPLPLDRPSLKDAVTTGIGAGKAAKLIGYKSAQLLSSGLIGATAYWAATYHAQTDKWPWEDEHSKLGRLPFPEMAKNDVTKKMWYSDKTGEWDDIDFFAYANQYLTRGTRALGLQKGYETAMLGGSPGQVAEGGFLQMTNTALSPYTSNPVAQIGSTALTGDAPYITSKRDDRGKPSLGLFRKVRTQPFGLQELANSEVAFQTANPFVDWAADKATNIFGMKSLKSNYNAEQQGPMSAFKFAMDIVAPRIMMPHGDDEMKKHFIEQAQERTDAQVEKEAGN